MQTIHRREKHPDEWYKARAIERRIERRAHVAIYAARMELDKAELAAMLYGKEKAQ